MYVGFHKNEKKTINISSKLNIMKLLDKKNKTFKNYCMCQSSFSSKKRQKILYKK